jgi:hypothetical protein
MSENESGWLDVCLAGYKTPSRHFEAAIPTPVPSVTDETCCHMSCFLQIGFVLGPQDSEISLEQVWRWVIFHLL